MAKLHPEITADLAAFIAAQPLFFVASAPLAAEGHVNLSPKGLETFRLLDQRTVAYLDVTGSGNETAAHMVENGRITFMFCAFTGPPRILRLYGDGRVVLPDTARWRELIDRFPQLPGARQIIEARISRIQTSCGFAVPVFDYVGQRDTLTRWAVSRGEDELVAYREKKNARSIDGLPAPGTMSAATPAGS